MGLYFNMDRDIKKLKDELRKKIKGKRSGFNKSSLKFARDHALPEKELSLLSCEICMGNAPFYAEQDTKICHRCSDYYLHLQLIKNKV